jgi:hypothetical protein
MNPPGVPVLAAAAQEIFQALRVAEVPACLIGGLAVHRWAEPRATADVDLTVLAPYGEEAKVLDALLGRFEARHEGARAFALQRRVLLLRSTNGAALDVALAAFPFELQVLERASDWEMLPGITVRTCSAEDLIIYKLVAARPQDLADVDGVVRRQGTRLDVDRIREWGRAFAELKEDPNLLGPFEDALRKRPRPGP